MTKLTDNLTTLAIITNYDFDPTELHTDKIKSEIINLKNSLLEEKIETPEFHLLPKTHKANNPRRPVISSINYHTSRISEFVDCYLQPEVKKIISYVKDTPDFVKKIETIDHLSDNSYLVSLDVRSLCTNILHKKGIETAKQKLRKSKPDISIKAIFTFLKPILTLNNFVFNGINYLQKKVALWALNLCLAMQIFLWAGLRKSLYFHF